VDDPGDEYITEDLGSAVATAEQVSSSTSSLRTEFLGPGNRAAESLTTIRDRLITSPDSLNASSANSTQTVFIDAQLLTRIVPASAFTAPRAATHVPPHDAHHQPRKPKVEVESAASQRSTIVVTKRKVQATSGGQPSTKKGKKAKKMDEIDSIFSGL
jgi:hypothetical protein